MPGPGTYAHPDLTKYKPFSNQNVKFGKSGRHDFNYKGDIPGPGSFNIESKFKGGYSMGKSKRDTFAEDSNTPGPGMYNLDSFKVTFLKL